MGSDLNIYQRLNKIREAVKYVQKDATVQGYKAVSHDQVTSVVRPELVKNGVFVLPTLIASKSVDSGKTMGQNKNPVIRFEATYDIAFVNMDSPEDRFVVTQAAHAEDQGDKAPGKACSYATKYAILKVFSLETGDGEESREEMRPKPITDEQAANIAALMDEVNADTTKFFKYLKISMLSDLDQRDYQKAITALEKKRTAG